MFEKFVGDEHSSLLRKFANHSQKCFITLAPGVLKLNVIYAECRVFIVMLSVVRLNVLMLSVMAPKCVGLFILYSILGYYDFNNFNK
jgi:hypothetical protein